MKSLSEYVDRPLRLIKKSFFSFKYDLVAGDEVLGTFDYKMFFGLSGFVKGFGMNNIEFYKEKFLSWEVCVREEGKELPFAKYKRDFGIRSAHVDLPQGNKFNIHYGFFDIATEINNENETNLVLLKRKNVFSRTMAVTIKEKSKLLDEYPWILFLVLYIIIRRRQRRK